MAVDTEAVARNPIFREIDCSCDLAMLKNILVAVAAVAVDSNDHLVGSAALIVFESGVFDANRDSTNRACLHCRYCMGYIGEKFAGLATPVASSSCYFDMDTDQHGADLWAALIVAERVAVAMYLHNTHYFGNPCLGVVRSLSFDSFGYSYCKCIRLSRMNSLVPRRSRYVHLHCRHFDLRSNDFCAPDANLKKGKTKANRKSD